MKQKMPEALLNKNLSTADKVEQHKQIIRTFKSKFNAQRRWYDLFADFLTEQFGTFWFFAFNFIWFVSWVFVNDIGIPGIPQFDPYPHNFLTMVVSLEAIFLSIIVLISQNRSSNIADMREEIDFNINIKAEQEITKILNIVDHIHDHLGLENEHDTELEEMKRMTDIDQMEETIKDQYTKKKKN